MPLPHTATLKISIPGNHIPVLPAELVTQPADGAVFPARLQPQDTESLRNHHTLLAVVGRRDTLEDLQTLKRLRTTLSLVGHHAADSAPEHLGGGAVVPWATAGRVETGLLAEEGLVLHCNAECCVSV